MKEQAVAKIKAEMQKNSGAYIQAVGQMLLAHVAAHPADSEKVLAEDKTVLKSLDAMREAARKVATNNCAVLTDEEGYAIVLKYFGIDTLYGSPGDLENTDFATSLNAYL